MRENYRYPALVSFGYGDGKLWVANFVGLHGCWVEGEDREDVVARAPSVLREYLQGCLDAGIVIPDAPDADDLRQLDMGEIILVSADIEGTGND